MTRRLASLVLVLAAALALPACYSSTAVRSDSYSSISPTHSTFSTHRVTIRNGLVAQDRTITATCSSAGTLQGDAEDATVTLGATTVHVTSGEIAWKVGSLRLPAAWGKLALSEFSGTIEVTLDDAPFGSIRPGG